MSLVVSSGPPPVVLPDVTGASITGATATLDRLGLRVSYDPCTNILCEVIDWRGQLTVVGTTPVPGTSVPAGSTIRLEYRQ